MSAYAKESGKEGDGEKIADILSKYKSQIDEVKGKLDAKLVTATTDDVFVYRFLRHNKFDTAKAAAGLNATLKWRAEFHCDEVRAKASGLPQEKWPNAEKIARYFPLNWNVRPDRKGRICEIDNMGHSRPAQLAKEFNIKDFTEFFLFQWEKTMDHFNKEQAKTGKVTRMVQISDMNGLGLKHLDMKGLGFIETVTTLFQVHYPDVIADIFIVNAPWLFNTFWKLSSSWLAEEVRNSTHVLDSVDKLKEYFTEDNLPENLGGKCKEGVREVDPDEGFTKVEVAASANHQVKVEVEKGSLVSWEYRTRPEDISFAATFLPKGAGKEAKQILCKLMRRPSHVRSMDGGFEAKTDGTLTLTWDNSYSTFRAKTVLFRVDQQKPEAMDKSVSDKLDTKTIEASMARLNTS
jgi:hypothetical protein